MSKKAKYNWNQPSLFPDDNPQPVNMELREIRTGINKNGEAYRNAIITKTKEYFIEQARLIWGDLYDYTDSVYTNNKQPITIYCPRHDLHFHVAMAQNHIMKPNGTFKPTGCPVCSYEQQHGKQYGPEWRETLRLSPKQNRVGRIVQPKTNNKHRSPEEIAAEKAKAEAKRREEQAYIDHWKAKNFFEARFKERVFRMYGDQYDMSLVDYQGNDKEVTLICRHHGMFKIRPRHLLVGITQGNGTKKPPHGCWKCYGLQDPHEKHVMTADEFFERMHQLYDTTELNFMGSDFHGKNKNVTAHCRKHGAITHKAAQWLDGKGCEYCNGKFWSADWIKNAQAKHGDKYKYFGDAPQLQSDYIHYICPEHGEIEQRYDVHVAQGCGCPKCANYPNKKTPTERCQEWINKCIEKYGEGRYDYSRAHEDYVNNDSLVWIRCCIHDHWFQQTPDNNLRTVNGSCPICSMELRESEGEATIRRWLQKHGILDFEQEYQLPNEDPTLPLQYLSADFYLLYGRDYIIIEYHGEQHYEDIPYFYKGRTRNFAVQQHRDRYLRQYCHDHQIKLLEIPYTDFKRIDEILSAYFEPKTE